MQTQAPTVPGLPIVMLHTASLDGRKVKPGSLTNIGGAL